MIDRMAERNGQGGLPARLPRHVRDADHRRRRRPGDRDRRRPRPPDHRRAFCAARSPTTSTGSTPTTGSSTRSSAPGAKGAGEFRRASWDEALDAAAAGLRARDRRPRRRVGAPLQLHGHPGGAPGRLDRQPADERDRRHRSSCGRSAPAPGSPASSPRTALSPEVDPEEWPHARYVLVWGWNPMSTAPHLWRKILEARRNGARLCVVDPFRSRTARVADEHLRPLPGTDAALALGMMRAVVDAGLADEEWCRAHADGYDELLERLGEHPVEHWAGDLRRRRRDRSTRVALDFARTQPALLRLGVGAQRHLGAPIAYRTAACLPALVGAWRHRGGGCSYIPTATAAAVVERRSSTAPSCGPAGRGGSTCRSSATALTDPELDPPVKALVVWSSNPAQVAPDQERVLEGLRREDLFTVVIEQFMTDTARHADVILPATTQLEHLDALFSWGHHYFTLNEPAIEPLGEAKPTTEAFRLLAARLGLDDPPFRETDEELLERLLAGRARRGLAGGAARARLGRRSTSARARRRTPRATSSPRRASSACAPTGSPTPASTRCRSTTRPRRRRGDGERRRALSAGDGDPEDPPVPELDLRQPGAPALGAARAVRGPQPGRRGRARGSRPARSCACSTTAARFAAAPRSPTTPAPASSSRRWAGGARDYPDGRGGQATTSQRLTAARRGADLQRQPGRGRAQPDASSGSAEPPAPGPQPSSEPQDSQPAATRSRPPQTGHPALP